MSEPFHIITITTYDADDTGMKNPKSESIGRVDDTSISTIKTVKQWVLESIISNKMNCIFGKDINPK